MTDESKEILLAYDKRCLEHADVIADETSKIIMTFREYDRMLEQFQKMTCKTYWPSLEELDLFQRNVEKYLPYACYLDARGREPVTKDEKYRKKLLRLFIQDNMELIENPSALLLIAEHLADELPDVIKILGYAKQAGMNEGYITTKREISIEQKERIEKQFPSMKIKIVPVKEGPENQEWIPYSDLLVIENDLKNPFAVAKAEGQYCLEQFQCMCDLLSEEPNAENGRRNLYVVNAEPGSGLNSLWGMSNEIFDILRKEDREDQEECSEKQSFLELLGEKLILKKIQVECDFYE